MREEACWRSSSPTGVLLILFSASWPWIPLHDEHRHTPRQDACSRNTLKLGIAVVGICRVYDDTNTGPLITQTLVPWSHKHWSPDHTNTGPLITQTLVPWLHKHWSPDYTNTGPLITQTYTERFLLNSSSLFVSFQNNFLANRTYILCNWIRWKIGQTINWFLTVSGHNWTQKRQRWYGSGYYNIMFDN